MKDFLKNPPNPLENGELPLFEPQSFVLLAGLKFSRIQLKFQTLENGQKAMDFQLELRIRFLTIFVNVF